MINTTTILSIQFFGGILTDVTAVRSPGITSIPLVGTLMVPLRVDSWVPFSANGSTTNQWISTGSREIGAVRSPGITSIPLIGTLMVPLRVDSWVPFSANVLVPNTLKFLEATTASGITGVRQKMYWA